MEIIIRIKHVLQKEEVKEFLYIIQISNTS